jgi:hypothetical protein
MTFSWGDCFDPCVEFFSASEIAALLAACLARIEFVSAAMFEGEYHGPSRLTFEMFDCTFYLDLQKADGEHEWVLRIVHIPPGKRRRKRRSDAHDTHDDDAHDDDASGGGAGAGAMPARAPRPPRKTAKRVLTDLYKKSRRMQCLLAAFLYHSGRLSDGGVELLRKFRVPERLRGSIEALRLAMMKRFGHLNESMPLGGARLEFRIVGANVGIPLIVSTFVAMAAPVDSARMIVLAMLQESEHLPL